MRQGGSDAAGSLEAGERHLQRAGLTRVPPEHHRFDERAGEQVRDLTTCGQGSGEVEPRGSVVVGRWPEDAPVDNGRSGVGEPGGDPVHPRGTDRVRLNIDAAVPESSDRAGDLLGHRGRADRQDDLAAGDQFTERNRTQSGVLGAAEGGRAAPVGTPQDSVAADRELRADGGPHPSRAATRPLPGCSSAGVGQRGGCAVTAEATDLLLQVQR